MDFLDRLVLFLDSQKYFSKVISPVLSGVNSIAVMPTPSNDYDYYYDGSFRQKHAFQILTRHTDLMTAYGTLNDISKLLLSVSDLPSENDSYSFEGFEIATDPSVIGADEKGVICTAQFRANLFINKKE